MLEGIDRSRPGDQRAFLHKKIFGGISKLAGVGRAIGIPGAGFVQGFAGKLSGQRQPILRPPLATTLPAGFGFTGAAPLRPAPVSVIPQTFQPAPTPTTFPGQPLRIGGGGGGGGGARTNGPCPRGTSPDPQGRGFCISPRSPFGAQEFGGEVIAGQYGAGFVAGSRIVDVAQCPRGTVLGKDGICYANLANRNRLYPRGRRPLLTGGDMRAISRARRAGNRMANVKTDLIAIGMLKAAGPRKRRKKSVPPC